MLSLYSLAVRGSLLWLPFLMLLMLIGGLGLAFWVSALNVEYRDVNYLMPFLIQVWFFLTPVVYPSSLIPESWKALYALNPMTGVIQGFRWSLLGIGPAPVAMLGISALASVVLFITGVIWFRSCERRFADAIGSGGG
jgi:lipopolysaccharide transport system permease protein